MAFPVQLIWMVVSYVVAAALQPKPPKPKPAAFDDFDFPMADEGTPQQVIFGDCWTGDWMVLSVGRFRRVQIAGKKKKWQPGLMPGNTNPIEAMLDLPKWTGNLSEYEPNWTGGDDGSGWEQDPLG
jgi:hypothetical protein